MRKIALTFHPTTNSENNRTEVIVQVAVDGLPAIEPSRVVYSNSSTEVGEALLRETARQLIEYALKKAIG